MTVDERSGVPVAPVAVAAPLLADALEQQLGLTLVNTKVTVEVLVIDRAERTPTAN